MQKVIYLSRTRKIEHHTCFSEHLAARAGHAEKSGIQYSWIQYTKTRCLRTSSSRLCRTSVMFVLSCASFPTWRVKTVLFLLNLTLVCMYLPPAVVLKESSYWPQLSWSEESRFSQGNGGFVIHITHPALETAEGVFPGVVYQGNVILLAKACELSLTYVSCKLRASDIETRSLHYFQAAAQLTTLWFLLHSNIPHPVHLYSHSPYTRPDRLADRRTSRADLAGIFSTWIFKPAAIYSSAALLGFLTNQRLSWIHFR